MVRFLDRDYAPEAARKLFGSCSWLNNESCLTGALHRKRLRSSSSASIVFQKLLVAVRLPLLWLVAASYCWRVADAFWLLGGESPSEFLHGAKVDMKVNKLISIKTQLPYDYYRQPFCKPDGGIQKTAENLGEVMAGDVVENTAYDLRMRENATCQLLCTKQLDEKSKDQLQELIQNEYTVNFMVDNLPATTIYQRDGAGDSTETTGFPVGVVREGKHYVHNYLQLRLRYHAGPENAANGFRIVGYEVEPKSLSPPPPGQSCQDTQVSFGRYFMQVGKWRMAAAGDMLLLQPSKKNKLVSSAANVFTSEMSLQRNDAAPEIFDRPVGTLEDAQLGDRFVQLGLWRLGALDGERFAVSYERGGLVVLGSSSDKTEEDLEFRKADGPQDGMAVWDREVGTAVGIEYGDRFIQIGNWRIGEVAQYLAIAHKSGKKTYVFAPFWSNTPMHQRCNDPPCIAVVSQRLNYGKKIWERSVVPSTCHECNWKCFIDRYPSVRDIVGGDLEQAAFHYRKYGKKQKLDCTCASRKPPEAVCQANEMQPLPLENQDEIHFMYDVQWEESETRWVSRWDRYTTIRGRKIHWLSILNSVMVTLALAVVLAIILLRTVFRDIAKYNEYATAEEAAEDTGWKLVHGDVFRKPRLTRLLAGSVGCGVQILGMSVVTLVLALAGLLSPSHRGAILQAMMIIFTLMGVVAGYTSAYVYKLFQGDDWKTTKYLTAFFYPGITFIGFFVLNLCVWATGSSGAVPITTMGVLLLLWFGLSVPLVFLGFKQGQAVQIELPVQTKQVEREVPELSCPFQPAFICTMAGLVPFGAVFTELHFMLSSLWLHQFYYLFGFLALVLLILIVICSEIAIAVTYFQLTMENHRWCWTSFLASGSSGGYLFAYSTYYFQTGLYIDGVVPTMLYFGYMSIASMFFCLMTGSIGMLSSAYFVRKIYGSIKVD